jgi:general secretion pathway protein A
MAAVEGSELIDAGLVADVVGDLGADQKIVTTAVAPAKSGSARVATEVAEGAGSSHGQDDAMFAPVAVHDPRTGEHAARIALLEQQVEAQEAALRRVLTLMIDWVERDDAQIHDLPRARPA